MSMTCCSSLHVIKGGLAVHMCLSLYKINYHTPVPLTSDVVSSNLDQGEVYNIMWKFVSDLRQVGGFLRFLWFPPPIKLTAMIKLKYCWK